MKTKENLSKDLEDIHNRILIAGDQKRIYIDGVKMLKYPLYQKKVNSVMRNSTAELLNMIWQKGFEEEEKPDRQLENKKKWQH